MWMMSSGGKSWRVACISAGESLDLGDEIRVRTLAEIDN